MPEGPGARISLTSSGLDFSLMGGGPAFHGTLSQPRYHANLHPNAHLRTLPGTRLPAPLCLRGSVEARFNSLGRLVLAGDLERPVAGDLHMTEVRLKFPEMGRIERVSDRSAQGRIVHHRIGRTAIAA